MDNDFKFNSIDKKISLGYRKWVKGSQNRHLHDGYEILYVVNGQRDMFIRDQVIHMCTGDIVIIPPNTLHKSFNNSDGSEIYSLYLNFDLSLSLNFFYLFRSNPISKIIYRIEKEFKNSEVGSDILINSLGLELFVLALRTQNSGIETNFITGDKTIMEVVSYINKNYQEDLSLDVLTKVFNLSHGHLSRSFKKNTSFSLIDYINHIRIQKSKELLQNSDHSISYICYFCGFGSLTNFGRLFKKLNGYSPSNYRKRT